MEVCVDSFESAQAAVQGGAQRIELCSSLDQGGLTPSIGLLRLIRRRLPFELQIFIMIRCRAGDFIYDDDELSVMEEEIRLFIESNQHVNGFVLGTLNPDGTIDSESLKRLVQPIPKDISLTFHRAFDFIPKWETGIDQLIELGFQRILTSGQETNAYYGRKRLRQMISYAQNRIIILPGCGISVANLESILRETGAKEFHSSARIRKQSKMLYRNVQKKISISGLNNDYEEDSAIQEIISLVYYHSDSIKDNLFDRTCHHHEQQLLPEEATKILQKNEASIDLEANCSVKYYEANHLGANNPPEDRQAQAHIRMHDSYTYLFGVFDGHGGPWCSDVLSQRLFDYIAVSLKPPNDLEQIMRQARAMINHNYSHISSLLLQSYHNPCKDMRNAKVKEIHAMNLLKHIEEVYTTFDSDYTDIIGALENAFIKLDRDICAEAIPTETQPFNKGLLQISMAGSCACVALINETDLYVANCGDARAVLGTTDDNGNPSLIPLSNVHNIHNQLEIKRVLSEHPSNEYHSVIRRDRLLGLLSPFRAFGNIRFKWPKNYLKEYLQPYYKNADALVQFYLTPPYLTVRPEIIKHKLTKNDKFLVLATDGVWDVLSPEKVVELIFNHQKGIQSLDQFPLQSWDRNSATNLIRHALAYTSKGHFDSKLFLDTLAFHKPRSMRDDITVTIVYFDRM
ncbi:unnamed protein product [Rotaria magnacalcarata]|uniref:Copper homeostasis protein cutC homolog n=4 Tax=Rotaria magnacalcarata TaxID=392030 RepID=A0A816A0S1_9BILA|nr:unnamed protein product [Rotaria magnacalcarata]CAF3993424.1 unnamed protein product [Rotaria magnacalcarata]